MRNIIKKESLVQVFCCEFCEISKNTFFTEHLRWLLLIMIPTSPGLERWLGNLSFLAKKFDETVLRNLIF